MRSEERMALREFDRPEAVEFHDRPVLYIKRRSSHLGRDMETEWRSRMHFDRQWRQVPGPGEATAADNDIARQWYHEAVRHRIDEGRALLHRPDVLAVRFGEGGGGHAAQPVG